jgi:hypothetical protein
LRKRTCLLAGTFLASGLVPLTLASPATAATAKYADDFNGDGFRDYAVFSYGNDSHSKGGGVQVTFGTATGPGTKTQFIDQSSAGVPGSDETDDAFGEVRTAADFNQDGYGDLAVAATGENVDGHADRGTVTVLWGGKNGLSGGLALPNKGPKTSYARMGSDLATGDFNGDGKPDLALVNAGKTYVYRGSISRSGVHGSVTTLDKDSSSSFYSTALVTGRVSGDKKTDLVIIGDVVTDTYIASDAWFIKGGSAKLYPGKTLRLESKNGNGGESDRGGDGVVGDFNKDGYGDIAIGTPLYDKYKGRVTVWYGGSSGPASPRTPAASRTRRRPTTPSATTWPPVTSTATVIATSRSARTARPSAARSTPAASTSCTAARRACPPRVRSGSRAARRASRAPCRPTTTSVRRSASATRTATARPTCTWGRRTARCCFGALRRA